MNSSDLSNDTPIVDLCSARKIHFNILSPYLMIFVGLRMLFSLFTIVANTKLLYLQRRAQIWYENERPIILGILFANITGATAVCVFGANRLIGFFSKTGIVNTWYTSLMVIISDSCILSLVLCTFLLTIQGYCVIRYFYQKNSRGIGKCALIFITCLIMLFALGISLIGLNKHGQAIFLGETLATDIIFSLGCYCVLFLTAYLLYQTRLACKKLQTDFIVNRADQCLEKRVALHRIVERTRTLIPISAINVIIWITLWSLDLIIDHAMIKTKQDASCGLPAEYYIWSSIMDITSAIYGLMYPSMLTQKQERISIQIRKALCCQYDLSNEIVVETPVTVTVQFENTTRSELGANITSAHWGAMKNQWERVAKSRKENA